MGIFDRFFEWLFPPEDVSEKGRKLYAIVPHGRLIWVPENSVDPEGRSEIFKKLQAVYPGAKVRLAYDEPINRFLALKLRELLGYEWRKPRGA